jgi:hypothetical protein
MARSILSTIFTTSCQSSHVVVVVRGLLETFQQLGNLGSVQKLAASPLATCGITHCLYWKRTWWIENSSTSSSIAHRQCNKQTPVEGVLFYWSFSLIPVFQPTFVSYPYFCVLIPTLVGENCRRFETTASLLGFLTCRSTNKSLQRELCHIEVWCLLMFFRPGLALQPTTVSLCWNWWEIFMAYATNKSPLEFPTSRATNGFL